MASLVETSLGSTPDPVMIELLRSFATNPALRVAVERFDPPFPDTPEFAELVLAYEGKRGSNTSLQAHLSRFLGAELPMSTATLTIVLVRFVSSVC